MTPVDPADLELLSSYLDDALIAEDRATIEARLTAEPILRAVLGDLRLTRTILRAAPTLAPPRNFTIDPARLDRRPTPMIQPVVVLRWVVGLAALLLVAVIARSALLSAGVQPSGLSAGSVVAVLPTGAYTMAPATELFALATASPAAKVASAFPIANTTAVRAAPISVTSTSVAMDAAVFSAPASATFVINTAFAPPETVIAAVAPSAPINGAALPSLAQPSLQQTAQNNVVSSAASDANLAGGATFSLSALFDFALRLLRLIIGL